MRARRAWFALLLALVAGPAYAQFTVSAGFEYFEWTEDTPPIDVRERGPLFALGLGWTQPKQRGFLFAYRGKFYIGEVDYNGAYLYYPNVPVSGTTRYAGTYQEAQLRYRLGGGTLDILTAAGVDYWQRKLNTDQKEDYTIGYVRLGIEGNPVAPKGWTYGLGVKFPVVTRENAHFTDLGYDQNPTLKPGKDLSVFGQIGYRFEKNWALIGYMDSFRFKQSNMEPLTINGVPAGTFYQPASDLYVFGLKLEYQF